MDVVQEEQIGEFTKDGSVDLKGNPALRSKTGGWTACSFVVVYEVFERMAYYGIATNLVLYLTRKLHQGTVTSANNVNNWLGTVWMMPILGAFIADSYLGRYWTFVIACTIYFLGMCLITLSVSIPALKPPPCHEINVTDCKQASTLQLGVFYTSLYILALGTGGTKPNISTIGADQFDDFEPKEKAHKLSFFNWWMFCIFIGTLVANTFLVYIQDNVGWALGYGIPTMGLAVSILIFLAGTPFYRHKLATGSPLTRMARVIVACIRKWKEPVPSDPKELYELDLEEYKKKGKFRIDPTPTLRFLNKAAIKVGSDTHHTPWMLCSVTQVEETKQMLRMTPILIAMFVPSVMVSQVNTLFVKQGTTLERHIGNFEIPPASLIAFSSISLLVSIVIYDLIFVKVARRWTKNPRGITLLKRIGIGIFLHIITMLIASLAERRRLGVAKDHGVVENGGKVPLSIFTLLPQFVSIGISEAVFEVGKLEFFYDQAPESMKSLGTSYSMLAIGVGHFISSIVLSSVASITKRHNHKGWILNNLNASHLDYYYAFLVILAALNLTFFVFVARFYIYRAEISDSMEILARKSRLS
ncbi:hypothetical protein Syun_030199 [Stephania yunnanensis]|uniref:Uncharacterized protein n=1 Tax=Stephania yunnanensis TaxID=152371 RepID=A0AAP0E6V9_9MAGN